MLTTVLILSATLFASSSAQASGAPTAAPSSPAAAATSPLPLTDYLYAYTDLPYKVNPFPVGRGPQSGFNQCNSTTTGVSSECQTAIINSISDFCLWGSSMPGQTVGDSEAAGVAFCTTDTHGARVIAPGAITAVQFMRTSAYIQITGRIDQTALNILEGDAGGEFDPHGADLLGNPVGGLLYTKSLPTGDNSTYRQAVEWNNFLGNGIFCFKVCDPSITSPNYCQNRYDLIGCNYNMPAAYVEDEFTDCEGDLQDEVGFYTGPDGQTSQWLQPRSLDPTTTLPYTPRIPASSNCRTYQSSELFNIAAVVTPTGSSSTRAPTNSAGISDATITSNTASRTPSSSGTSSPARTSSAAPGSTSAGSTGGATSLVVVGSTSLFALAGGVILLGGVMMGL